MERATHAVEQLKGPIVPVNTCFGDDDSLDVGTMRKYVNWLCEQHIPVILLTYGSSEFCRPNRRRNLAVDCRNYGRRNIRPLVVYCFHRLVAPRTVPRVFETLR